MKRIIVVAALLTATMAACGSSDNDDGQTATPATTQSSGAAPSAAPSPEASDVMGVVASHVGCTDTRPGGCWLPLGETPTHEALVSPNPINMSIGPDSRCDDKTALKHCWPQPDAIVIVVCQKIVADEMWVAIFIPLKEVLHPVHTAESYNGGLLGWNRKQYVRPESTPRTCPD